MHCYLSSWLSVCLGTRNSCMHCYPDSASTSSSHATPTNTEIQIYTTSGHDYANIRLDDENFNILQFWHNVKGVFPILSSMARDIFAVPASTVASESCFSAANRILTDKRTRLGPEIFEALVLVKDWMDADLRLQDKSWMHAIDATPNPGASSNQSSEATQETNASQQFNPAEMQDPYSSNPYMYNYEEYGYALYNAQYYQQQ